MYSCSDRQFNASRPNPARTAWAESQFTEAPKIVDEIPQVVGTAQEARLPEPSADPRQSIDRDAEPDAVSSERGVGELPKVVGDDSEIIRRAGHSAPLDSYHQRIQAFGHAAQAQQTSSKEKQMHTSNPQRVCPEAAVRR
jgi:hypothetical protein